MLWEMGIFCSPGLVVCLRSSGTGSEEVLNLHLFRVTSHQYPMWFSSQWICHHLEEFQTIAASKAATMGHIQRGHLKQAMTICPPDGVLTKLGSHYGSVGEQNHEERTGVSGAGPDPRPTPTEIYWR